jgi:hypothetical protein
MTAKKLGKRDFKKALLPLAQKEKVHTKSASSNPAMRRFDEHPFYKNLMKYAIVPLFEENKKAKKENREIGDLGEEFMYHFHVFEYSGAFYEALKRIHDVPLFARRGFSLQWMSKTKVTPQDWFVYNYANYRVIAYGLFDTALLMVNDVLDIQEEPKNVKSSFIKRQEIADNGLLPALQKLDKVIGKYRDERNRYVHRSTRPEVDFVNNLAAYELLKEAKEQGFYKGDVPDRKKAQRYYEEERDKQVAKMQKETEEIFAAVIEFLNALHPLYEQKIQEYQSK